MSFIVKLPDQAGAGQIVDTLAQHVDLLPTTLNLLGVGVPAHVQGRSLWPSIESQVATGTASAVSYLHLDGPEIDSLISPHGKLIRYLAPNQAAYRLAVYDLEVDPSEQHSLVTSRAVLRGYLQSSLKQVVFNRPMLLTPGDATLDEELEERLRTLGYLR